MNIQEIKTISDSEHSEPTIDVETFEWMEQLETEKLITALVEYARSLELQVVELRGEVNKRTPPEQEKPFPEVHSDLYETFDQFAAYPKFKHLFEPLE